MGNQVISVSGAKNEFGRNGRREKKRREARRDTACGVTQRAGYRDLRQAVHDTSVPTSLQQHAAQGQGQAQPPQQVQYPPGYAHGLSGQLPGYVYTQWSSGELPQNMLVHGNSLQDGGGQQYGSGQLYGGHGARDPTVGYPNAGTYVQGLSGQLSNNASTERLSGQLPTMTGEYDKQLWREGRDGAEPTRPRRNGRIHGRASLRHHVCRAHARGYGRWEQRSRKE